MSLSTMEICRQNLAALQGVEVYPYAVYRERAKVKLVIARKNSAVSNYGVEVEAVTFNEILGVWQSGGENRL